LWLPGKADGANIMKNPHIKTALPGPKARELIARDALVVSPSYPRDYPFVMSHGRGAEVWDVDGNRFLDFAAGIAVCSTGHSHPAVVAAIGEAAERFLHISSDFWHEGQVRLAERINELSPMREPVMSFFAQSGTESVEGALKLARYVTGRPRFLGFLGGFHGRTMGSLAFTSSKYTQQKGFFATMPGVTHVPYPNPFRPLLAGADQGQAVLRYIEDVLFAGNVPASEVAGILIEPIQGEGGYIVPPDGFLAGLRALCDRHGILLIFDEVQTGIGRTGTMFASQQWNVAPDIMTLAKGLGSGLPIGMVVAKKTLMEKWTRGAHGNTYGGNPLCCAAALATLELVEREYRHNAARVGEYFMQRLRALAGRYEVIGEVRGKGLMIGMELVTDRSGNAPARKLCDALVTRAFHNGLLLLSCGASTLRFMPPLMIDRGLVDEAMQMIDASLVEALAAVNGSVSEAPVFPQDSLQRRVR
jgi:4-aminobutyrate aminotransferase